MFGKKKYIIGKEYKLPINDIVVTFDFLMSPPRVAKFVRKENDYLRNHELRAIELNRKNEIVDGFCSFLIAKKYGIEKPFVKYVE